MNFIKYTVKVYDNGDKYWYLNDKLHREDGPAIECSNGDKEWCLNDKLHREDGPAIEYGDGSKYWCLNDEELSEEEFNKIMNKRMKSDGCEGKIVEIDGKRYQLVELN
jgi:hypothetical protein